MGRAEKRVVRIIMIGFLTFVAALFLDHLVEPLKNRHIQAEFTIDKKIQLFCQNDTSTYNNFYESQHFYITFNLSIDLKQIWSKNLNAVYFYILAEKTQRIGTKDLVSSSIVWDKTFRCHKGMDLSHFKISETKMRTKYPFRDIDSRLKDQSIVISLYYENQLSYGYIGHNKIMSTKITLPSTCVGDNKGGLE